MILRVPGWERFDWLEHGFGTRLSPNWTDSPQRTFVNQIHSDAILQAELPGSAGDGDALAANADGLLLEIRTADCVPVLIVDPELRAVAAIHAGWRGTAAAIVQKTVSFLHDRYGSRPAAMIAAIGPSIGECCFEVGPEVAVQFGGSGRSHLNLRRLNRAQLAHAGLMEGNITDVGGCTRCESDLYHSFRRDRDRAGRMQSAIGIRHPEIKRGGPKSAP